jgi:peroxiredoxin
MFRNLMAQCLLILALGVVAPAFTAAEPTVGQKFSQLLAEPDQTGKPRTLKNLQAKKGLAVFFVRSADWCPFCKGQLADVNRHLPQFLALGINVVSVSVDAVPVIAEFSAQQQVGYPMLSDPKGDINLALGIRDTQYPVGSAAFGVPRPTLYVLDRRGIVRLRYREPTFRTRPNLDEVLKDIGALGL